MKAMRIFKKKKSKSEILAQECNNVLTLKSDFFIREAYNTLRSNISFSFAKKGCKIVEITSTNPSEGKSITAVNVALAFAEVNKKVLLIDADMRRPKVHRLLQLNSVPGLSNVLVGDCEVSTAIQKYKDIDVLCSGENVPNSTALLESDSLEEFFHNLSKDYDYIIIDTPPVNTVVDGCIIAQYTSGIVFVIRQDYAKKEHIVSAVNQIEFAGGKIIGFVLNNVSGKKLISFNKYRKYDYKGYRRYAYKSHHDS